MEIIRNRIIIALDFSTGKEVATFLRRFETKGLAVKVGMELFYQQGPQMITDLKDKGCEVFLDLKLHDIPNTVKNAMKGIAKLGVDMINVHAAGGLKMMEAAIEGLEQGTPPGKQRPICIGVTQLTSTSQQMMNEDLLIQGELEDVVVSYAKLTQSSGLDGVVCSPLEVPIIKEACGSEFVTVTPGIRLSTNTVDDQVRIATPQRAKQLGSDYIVVGRTITKSTNPLQTHQQIQAEWSEKA